jgi:hypothetical protein
VRSGPGEEYYETARARLGDEVEVYRHDPHGWCAIRPPPGSFSLVPAEHLKLLEPDVAETAVAGVKSLVGSSTGDQHDRSHVSLRRGERVVLLEKPSEGLCKIAPPAGEFRWIHRKCLQRLGSADHMGSAPGGALSQRRDARSPSADQWRAAPRTTAFDATNNQAIDAGRGTAFAEGVTAGRSKPRPVKPRAVRPQYGWVPPSSADSGDEAPDAEEPAAEMQAGSASTALPTVPVAIRSATDPLGVEAHAGGTLDEIELALAAMVCQPRNRWTFDQLRDHTKGILGNAQSTAERDHARRLLDRMAQFEDIRRRALGLPPSSADETGPIGNLPAKSAAPSADEDKRITVRPTTLPRESANTHVTSSPKPTPPAPSSPPNWEDSRFDGAGRLVPLEKRADGDPQFLLVDAQGVARYFVTPAPGVNLRYYRDRMVGITGSRADDPEGGKPHLTAHRVTVLPDAPRR